MAISNPALWCCLALQSCLCPTPDLRSFHMGIALSTLTTLPAPLRALSRWLQQNLFIETEQATGNAPAASHSKALHGHASPRHHGVTAGSGTAGNPAPTPRTGNRPLRGTWPFNVRPPGSATEGLVGPSASNNRTFLPTSSMGSRDAFLASLSSDGQMKQSARVLRRVSDTGTGRLVIAGRMADVCAELDRMAALENLQPR